MSPELGRDYQPLQQLAQPIHIDAPQPQLDTPSLVPNQTQDNRGGHDQLNRLNQLALLADVVEPAFIQRVGFLSTTGPEQPQTLSSVSGRANDRVSQHIERGGLEGSYGTLIRSDSGRSKYLGPTAGSEWLKDVSNSFNRIATNRLTCISKSEAREMSITPTATRAPSLEPRDVLGPFGNQPVDNIVAPIAFPFSVSPARLSTRDLLSKLPMKDETWILAEAYYRYCAWQ